MKKISKFLFENNPIFVMLLGMCSTLAASTTFERSYLMGLSIFIVLFLTSIIVSLISKYITDEIRIITYIIIIATLVTVLELLLKNYANLVYISLGIYLPLITVNCLILGKALSFFSKNSIKKSIKDSLHVGIQYLFSISVFGLIRELLGTGKITIMDNISNLTGYKFVVDIISNEYFINNLFVSSAGAFITLGFMIGIINHFSRKEEK